MPGSATGVPPVESHAQACPRPGMSMPRAATTHNSDHAEFSPPKYTRTPETTCPLSTIALPFVVLSPGGTLLPLCEIVPSTNLYSRS